MLSLNQIEFHYSKKKVLADLSFSLKEGEIGTLIGSSGSGKTTIFKILSGLLPPQKGIIRIKNEEILHPNRHIACMMQEDLLLPWRTVLDNLLLPSELGSYHDSKNELLKDAKELLNEMNLSECINMYPDELSVGMRQRVSLTRALLQNKPILLLDEPFASLDVALREQMYHLLKRIQKKKQQTILMVSHDFRDAITLSDHVFFLNDGKIEKTWKIPKEVTQDPKLSLDLSNQMRDAIVKY